MLNLGDLMTTDVVTLEPEMTLREAGEKLSAGGLSGAPVVSTGRLVGVLSGTDLLEFESTNPGVPTRRSQQAEWGEWGPADLWEQDVSEPPSAYFVDMWADSGADVAERIAEPESPEWDFLEEHVVGEVMTRKVIAFPPNTDVTSAARVMVDKDVHRVLIAEGDKLFGIVTTMDLVRAIADGRLRP